MRVLWDNILLNAYNSALFHRRLLYDKIMKLMTSIIWLCGGIFGTMNAARDMTNLWYWIFAAISFVACIAYAIAFDKQPKK